MKPTDIISVSSNLSNGISAHAVPVMRAFAKANGLTLGAYVTVPYADGSACVVACYGLNGVYGADPCDTEEVEVERFPRLWVNRLGEVEVNHLYNPYGE